MKTSIFRNIFSFELVVAIIMILLAYCSYAQPVSPAQLQLKTRKYVDDKGRMTGYDSAYLFGQGGNARVANQLLNDFRQLGKAGVVPFTSPFSKYTWFFNRDFSTDMARMREEIKRSVQEMMDAIQPRQNRMNNYYGNGKMQDGDKTL